MSVFAPYPVGTEELYGMWVHATKEEWDSAMESQREIFIGLGHPPIFAVTKKHRESRSKRNAKDV